MIELGCAELIKETKIEEPKEVNTDIPIDELEKFLKLVVENCETKEQEKEVKSNLEKWSKDNINFDFDKRNKLGFIVDQVINEAKLVGYGCEND